MSNLSVFGFNQQEIRFVDGKPVAIDVAKVLGYADPKSAVKDLVSPNNKGVGKIPTIRYGEKVERMQELMLLEEAGVYQLIFKSKLPSAEKFQKWVFEEVLPQIRKTGSYGARPGFEWFERVKLYRRHTKIPTGWFSIFEEMCSSLMADFEDAGYSLPMGSVPDISVGKCFCNHLRSLGHGLTPGNGLIQEYQHHYPDGRVVTANIYNDSLLSDYRRWFKETYRTEKLPAYLKGKDPKALPSLCQVLGLPEGSH